MPAITVDAVHKAFRIPHQRRTTLTERLLGLLRPIPYERFEALCGVDLTVERGSFVGIIGNNGSGKSTLLKIVAGLLVADAGEVRVDGSVSALLELGLGFSPELTVRENVELYGAVLGFPRRQMAARIESAIGFAELERFRDAKLKSLSTGMQMRLAFATALQAHSDIMLLDEILAVGDASFQRKCLDVFTALKQHGTTVLLVSHNLDHVRRFCDRAVLLEAGRVAAQGSPGVVITRYVEGTSSATRLTYLSDGRMRVGHAWLEDAGGATITRVRSGDRLTFAFTLQANADVAEPVLGVMLRNTNSAGYVYAINTQNLGLSIGTVRAGESVAVRVTFLATLRDGTYALDAAVADWTGTSFHDWVNDAAGFEVTGSTCRDGLVDLHAEFEWREPASTETATNAQLRAGARTGVS